MAGDATRVGDGPSAAAVARLVREERTRILATLIRVTGSVDLAEDATQDAVVRALETWPRDGVPENPRAWLLVVARRRAVDLIRREARRAGKEAEAVSLLDPAPENPESVRDDLLRLIFTCCHPALSLDAQVALALRTLAGLSTAEVARGLLVPEATMAKRLTRAKQKIAQARIPYRVPAAEELTARLSGVAATVYLIFNEGYAAGAGDDLLRTALTGEAIRLARLLAELMPDEATVLGLLALLLLQDSRRAARTDADGRLLLLAEQDRSRWDPALVTEGVELVGRALRRTAHRPDRYVVQAAVAACHALAPAYDLTPWDAVVSWYDVLLTVHDTPVVRLNRAAAVAERDGPAAGLALVDAVDGLTGYPWWHATRGELLRRLDRPTEAVAAYDRALALDLSGPQAEHLRRRRAELTD
ncbi:RNA polymerase subunit sigma-24 [Micromonospora globispora]|uniref:RNA polymerase subunit sigma-24 n=1 Tax=Micromonospora globispora TaxID=1450148 RepID=A0A317JW06_9ACTN|nr:RNA polymerase subunit sigma-24 [Micromonospora globispora]PWU58300.1 RNA polymerase subunit sigma-24 [Micromonospora globispora]RQX00158.1 RNA polymerase subunit sigma-24 [Micromonospora globispora]